jgi:hypothetical protein
MLYEIGEEYLLSLLHVPEQCRSNIDGLSNTVIFNENDHYSSREGIIHFYLTDKNNNTFSVLVNLLKNRFNAMYWDEDQEYNNDMIFSVSGFPYDISEEWHFQLSTLKEVPFSYEFITRIKEFVKYFEDMMQIHHSIELLREHHNIIPYPCR